MLLYEIALPKLDNAGRDCTAALLAWEQVALTNAGGFTRLPHAVGAWRGNDGREYHDIMQCYRVAVDTAPQFAPLLNSAFVLFPDQVAIFYAQIGTATIRYRNTQEVHNAIA